MLLLDLSDWDEVVGLSPFSFDPGSFGGHGFRVEQYPLNIKVLLIHLHKDKIISIIYNNILTVAHLLHQTHAINLVVEVGAKVDVDLEWNVISRAY